MRHYKKHRKNPRRRKSSGAGDVLRVVLVAAGVGGIVYIVYQIVSNSPVAGGGGGILPSAGNTWDYLYNAATGKPTASQIGPPPVYTGPGAPAQNSAMQSFIANGHNVSDIVPGTGSSVSDLVNLGYTWSDINSMFSSAPSLGLGPDTSVTGTDVWSGLSNDFQSILRWFYGGGSTMPTIQQTMSVPTLQQTMSMQGLRGGLVSPNPAGRFFFTV